jgi:hypothetical protein
MGKVLELGSERNRQYSHMVVIRCISACSRDAWLERNKNCNPDNRWLRCHSADILRQLYLYWFTLIWIEYYKYLENQLTKPVTLRNYPRVISERLDDIGLGIPKNGYPY